MINWPAIGKKLGFDAGKYCGPVACYMGYGDKERCCPYGHAKGCDMHAQVTFKGKDFNLRDYFDQFKKEGLISYEVTLKEEREQGKSPPGPGKRNKHGSIIYPARHFA